MLWNASRLPRPCPPTPMPAMFNLLFASYANASLLLRMINRPAPVAVAVADLERNVRRLKAVFMVWNMVGAFANPGKELFISGRTGASPVVLGAPPSTVGTITLFSSGRSLNRQRNVSITAAPNAVARFD
jgi:hypothetical protein